MVLNHNNFATAPRERYLLSRNVFGKTNVAPTLFLVVLQATINVVDKAAGDCRGCCFSGLEPPP